MIEVRKGTQELGESTCLSCGDTNLAPHTTVVIRQDEFVIVLCQECAHVLSRKLGLELEPKPEVKLKNSTSGMLKSFTSGIKWWNGLWGNGHTVETDPAEWGWRVQQIHGNVVLVGRPCREGCFSAIPWSNGQVNLAIYTDTPEYMAEMLKVGSNPDARFIDCPNVPGWGLKGIEEVVKELQDDDF